MNEFLESMRELNRKRNYTTKKLKLKLRLMLADKYTKSSTVLIPSRVRKIIILMIGKGIGDAIVMTGLIKALTDMRYEVSVLCEIRIRHIFSGQTFIKELFIISGDEHDHELLELLRKVQYDLLIEVDDIDIHSPLRLSIIKKISAKHVIGVNQFCRVYDTKLNRVKRNSHISNRHIKICQLLGSNITRLHYCIGGDNNSEREVMEFVSHYMPQKIIVINPYGTEESRNMSMEQINKLCSFIKYEFKTPPFIIGVQNKIGLIPDSDSHIKLTLPLFSHAVALLEYADVVISTDTSIVHLCNALNKDLVCLYNNKILSGGEDNNIVWGPGYSRAIQVFSPDQRVDGIDIQMVFNLVKLILYQK